MRRTLFTDAATAALLALPATAGSAAPATTDGTSASRSAATATAATTAGTSASRSRVITRTTDTSFTTPSGRIFCSMNPVGKKSPRTFVTCEIVGQTWTLPKPKRCAMDYDLGFELYRKKVSHRVCAGDSIIGTTEVGGPSTSWLRRDRGVVVRTTGFRAAGLRYGYSMRVGDTTCTSSTKGVTFRNTTGHGFFMSKRSYRTW